jgi:hypothetical protein
MNLSELGKLTSYQPHEIKYFLSFFQEIGASNFVSQMLQAAYDIGFEDGWEHKGELDSAPKEAQP